jgi:hypothetical protein
MAPTAETAARRLARSHEARVISVSRGSLVTRRTLERRVVRDGELRGDLTMTRGACAWRHGGDRRVRRVAALARHPRVVRHRVDLREPRRSRRVVGVTQGALIAPTRNRGFDVHRSVRVRRGRPVAHFAREPPVIPVGLHLGDITVAHTALPLPCVLDGVRGNEIERRCAVVAFVAEGLGNEEAPRYHQRGHRDHEHECQSGNLLRYPHKATPRETGARCCSGTRTQPSADATLNEVKRL